MTKTIPTSLRPDALATPHYATPFMVIDPQVVLGAYRTFSEALPSVAAHYAMKCNPDARIIRLLQRAGCKFEVASYAELKDLTRLGIDAHDVLYSNPVKPWAHIRDAYRAGLYRFSFDSEDELDKLAAYAPGSSVYARLKTEAASTVVPSEGKFGVNYAAAHRLLQSAKKRGLEPYGIAFHVGTQMQEPEAWDEAISQSAQLMRVLAEEKIFIQMLDIGGGFPGYYEDEAKTPPIATFAAHINRALADLPYKVAVTAEPGRALVANAGVMVATVLGIAERGGKQWVHLDVGAFNGMMEALESNNTLRFPLADSKQNPLKARYHLTGPTCDSQDTILFDAELSADIATNDRVYLYTAGAYTTAYASTFNGFALPRIYMINEGTQRPRPINFDKDSLDNLVR